MSYVEKHLMPGEQIEYRANLHWLVFLVPILLFIPAVWLYFVGGSPTTSGRVDGTLLVVLSLPSVMVHSAKLNETIFLVVS